ncbi:MAG TPA: sulfatase [Polyangia bacterium]|nr:sulfatase [Polyangia bacterium]
MIAATCALLATHVAFHLVDNRMLMHARVRGGLGIAAGAPSFAKYARFGRSLAGWTRGDTVDGKRVSWAGAQAVLEAPLHGDEGPFVFLHVRSAGKQSLRITQSGKSSLAVPLVPGWQTVKVTMPAGALHAGENELRLIFGAGGKKAAAIEWIQVGGQDPPVDAAPPSAGDASGLTLPIDAVLYVPPHALFEGTGEGAPGCRLHVRVVPESGAPVEGDAPLDLGALAGRVVRLELSGCPRASRAALTVPGEARPPSRAPAPTNVVVWLTDNTRADRIKIYNPKTRVETPVLTELAKTSTVFRAYSQGSESRVSHASLWTALYPVRHGFIPADVKLKQEFVTMAEALRPSGRWIAGVSANGFIDKYWGFEQGWDAWHNNLHQGGGLSAGDVVKTALDMLRPRMGKPFYFYVGTIDAHTSWRAHEPWIGKYDRDHGAYQGPFVKACLDPQLERIVTGQLPITERDKLRIKAIYDSDVSYNDAQLGKFLAELAQLGHADDTMVIVTSDHGEEFWERGKIGHGQSLKDELVWVPLVVHYPPLFPARVIDGADLLDVVPTVLDAWGVKPPPDWQGESLLPVAQGEGADYPRPSIASQYELAHAMRLGSYKVWVSGTGASQLYDIAADPGETRDIQAAHPLARRWLTDAFSTFLIFQKQWRKARWGVASNHKPALPQDLER